MSFYNSLTAGYIFEYFCVLPPPTHPTPSTMNKNGDQPPICTAPPLRPSINNDQSGPLSEQKAKDRATLRLKKKRGGGRRLFFSLFLHTSRSVFDTPVHEFLKFVKFHEGLQRIS